MAVNINWGMAQQQPNYSNALLNGFEQGRQVAQQQRSDNALAAYQQNPTDTGALNSLAAIDPARATALLNVKAAQQKAADTQTQHTALKGMYGTDGKVNPNAVSDYISTTGDAEGAVHLQTLLTNGTKEQKDAAAESAGAIAAAGQQISGLPYEQRRSALSNMAPLLAQHGVTQDMIQSFDPTDDNITTRVTQSLGLAKALDRSDKTDKDEFDHEKFAETKRHDLIGEGNSAGNLMVRRVALALAGQKRGDKLAGSAGATTPDLSDHTDEELMSMATGN